jgi:type VI secretion system protein VasI
MRGIVILALTITFLPAPARAQDDPKACAAIADNAKRLECFDLIFKKSSVTTTSAKSEWVVTEEKSKIDDSTNVFMMLDSTQPIKNQYGAKAALTIAIFCREKKTDFYIIFGGHFMSSIGNAGVVTFRVDKKPATQTKMTESNDHKALGLWGGASSIPFIKALFGGSTLFVRATPYSESSISGEFNISGFQEATKPLRQACGWKD